MYRFFFLISVLVGCISAYMASPASAQSAWIVDTPRYPPGFAQKEERSSGIRKIHGDGTPAARLSGSMDGFSVTLPGPQEDARATVDIKSDYRKIMLADGYKALPLDWSSACYVSDPDITCTAQRPVYGSKQDEESRVELRGQRGPICVLDAFSEPISSKVIVANQTMITDAQGCLSPSDTSAFLDMIGAGGKEIVTFDTSDGVRRSNLSGISTVLRVLGWLEENSMRPSNEMLLDAYQQRFFACGWLGGELSARTANITLTEYFDQVLGQGFGFGSPLQMLDYAKPRMQAALMEGAMKYRGEESELQALEIAYSECTGPATSRYLFWSLGYP